MKRIILLVAFVLSFAAADACECPPLQKFNKEIAASYDLIFLGTVDSVGECVGDKSSAYFVIEKLFKGEASKRFYVNFDCVTDCRMYFREGEKWLIYAEYAKFGDPRVDFCGRSRKYADDANEDFAIATHGMTFKEELDFIKTNFQEQKLSEKPRALIQNDIPERELIHPDGKQTIILLAISLVGMLLLWFVIKKFWK